MFCLVMVYVGSNKFWEFNREKKIGKKNNGQSWLWRVREYELKA